MSKIYIANVHGDWVNKTKTVRYALDDFNLRRIIIIISVIITFCTLFAFAFAAFAFTLLNVKCEFISGYVLDCCIFQYLK